LIETYEVTGSDLQYTTILQADTWTGFHSQGFMLSVNVLELF